MKQIIKDILGVLGIVFGVVLIIYVIFIIKQQATGVDYCKTVQMSADGKVTAKPDLAQLSFSVITQGKDAAKVQTDNDAKMSSVIDYLKTNGVNADDIQTSGYNLYPQYDYTRTDATQQIIGYNLNQNVTAKIRKLETVSTIVGGLTAKGINQINNVGYTIDDPDKLKQEARDQAIDKAKQKAQELADRIGVRLGKVVNFSEGSSYMPQPYYAYDKAMSSPVGMGGGSSPIESGTQDVTVSVTLTFELK